MRATFLLPATCLTLLAAPAAAQQAAPAPAPAEAAPPPPSAAEQPATGQRPGMPREMERGTWAGAHGHPGMFQAPGLRIRVGGISLDLRCAVGDTTEACAQAALGTVDHLSQTTQGGGGQGDNADQGSDDDNGGDGNDGGGDQ